MAILLLVQNAIFLDRHAFGYPNIVDSAFHRSVHLEAAERPHRPVRRFFRNRIRILQQSIGRQRRNRLVRRLGIEVAGGENHCVRPGNLLYLLQKQFRGFPAGYFALMVIVRIKEIERLAALEVFEFSPRADSVAARRVPAFARDVRRLGKPEIPLVEHLEAVFFIDYRRVLARILAVIAACADVGIVSQLEDALQLVLEALLRAEDVKIMEAHEAFHHLLAVWPRVGAVVRRVHA